MRTYAEKLKDPRWQKKRLDVMQRDKFTCRDCGDTKKTLHVHHCAYTGRDPWNAPLGILLTLCEDCHEKRQELENDAHTMLGQIMARMNPDELNGIVQELSHQAVDDATMPMVVNGYDYDALEGHLYFARKELNELKQCQAST